MVTNLKFKDDSDLVIEAIVRGVLNNVKGKQTWSDDNTVEFGNTTTKIGKLVMDDREITATGEKVIKVLQDMIDLKKKHDKIKITPDIMKKSVFEKYDENKNLFGNLDETPVIFLALDKAFKKLKIEKVFNSRSSVTRGDSVQKKLTVMINPEISDNARSYLGDGFERRLRGLLFKNYDTDARTEEELNCVRGRVQFSPLEQETIEPIKIDLKEGGNAHIGNYHKERNLVHLFFNPFTMKKPLPLSETSHPVFTDIFEALEKLKIEKQDSKNLERKLFISAFLDGQRNKLNDLKRNLDEYQRRVKEREQDIRRFMVSYHNDSINIDYIQKNISNNGEEMFKELDLVEKLPFIKKVELGAESIKLLYKEATITVPNYSLSDHGKEFGKRTMYLGEISFTISPSLFRTSSSYPILKGHNSGGSHSHPHANSGDGQPCFGDGDGRNKIYEMLSANKFSEVAKILWFWIKTYRNSGAYVKQWDTYNDRLKHGLPVWDDKGKRIELNDPERIKAGEQTKLEPAEDYEENIKKFKDVKIF